MASLVLLWTITISALLFDICISACIHSFADHNIDYMSSNTNTDPFVYYLGIKSSMDECEASCINLNYLCDKSNNDISYDYYSNSQWIFDSDTCSITGTTNEPAACTGTTHDIVANEYILELQVTINSGSEAGLFWRSNLLSNSNMHGYFFGINGGSSWCGRWDPDYDIIEVVVDSQISTNDMLNLSVNVNHDTFTTYVNDIKHFTYTQMDASFTAKHAGIYGWNVDATFHSFRVKIPNAVERFCSAYVYDKVEGSCYGYYGDDYTTIEASLSSDTEQKYDAAIRYDVSCAPTDEPTVITAEPTIAPTSDPTVITVSPTITLDPTSNPSESPLTNAPATTSTEETSSSPTPAPTEGPSLYPTLLEPDVNVITSTAASASTTNTENELHVHTTRNLNIFVMDDYDVTSSDHASNDNMDDNEVKPETNEAFVTATLISAIVFCICGVLCLLGVVYMNQRREHKRMDLEIVEKKTSHGSVTRATKKSNDVHELEPVEGRISEGPVTVEKNETIGGAMAMHDNDQVQLAEGEFIVADDESDHETAGNVLYNVHNIRNNVMLDEDDQEIFTPKGPPPPPPPACTTAGYYEDTADDIWMDDQLFGSNVGTKGQMQWIE